MAEPLTVIRHRETHEWRLVKWDWRPIDPWTWELHYLPVDNGIPLRCADEYEAALLDECKRLVDSARGVTVARHQPVSPADADGAEPSHA